MIEPTGTESKQTLHAFVEVMLSIADAAKTNPQLLKEAPHAGGAPTRRRHEVRAAKHLILRAVATGLRYVRQDVILPDNKQAPEQSGAC